MPNELFEKVCRQCGKVFRTDNERVRICLSCKKYNKRLDVKQRVEMLKKPKVKNNFLAKTIPIREYSRIIERYNQRHNTRYTYGQFEALVNQGKIDILEEIKIEKELMQR